MNRYENLKFEINEMGNRRISTSYLLPIPISANDIYINSDVTTRLDVLALLYYNDVTTWPIIAVSNNLGHGSIFVQSNIQIRIPDPNQINKYIADIANKNK